MAWAPDYITSAEMKAYVNIGDTVDDVQAGYAITAASRAIDKCAGRQFGQVAVAEDRFYTAVWDRHRRRYIVTIDDLATTTNLVVTVAGTAVTTYTLAPRNAVAKGLVWTELVFDLGTFVFGTFGSGSAMSTAADLDGVKITALWGWPAVPVPVKQACTLQASRFLKRRDSPFGVAGSPDNGSELRLLAKVDPDVAVSLGHYMRVWGAV